MARLTAADARKPNAPDWLHACAVAGCEHLGSFHEDRQFTHWYCLHHWRERWQQCQPEQPASLRQAPLW